MKPGRSSFSKDINPNDDLIGSATSAKDIIAALARRGCVDLTSSINLPSCSDFPCAGGGFCDVYRGGLHGGARIAIKVLRVYDRPEVHGDSHRKNILKRAARELYHWSKLQHRNVLPLMGLAVFRGHISMVSPWMENDSLVSYIRIRPGVNRIGLCMDICAGLCYIHTSDMVHGDLKAANVMISSNGTALIADFGNAQLKDLTLKFSNTAQGGLSVRWAAPELLLADDGPYVSKEADVYAYGMTMLEALTGEVPYNGANDNRVICLVAYEKKLPSRPDIGLNDELWNILTSCWTREPSERPGIANVSDRLQALFPSPSKQESPDDELKEPGLPRTMHSEMAGTSSISGFITRPALVTAAIEGDQASTSALRRVKKALKILTGPIRRSNKLKRLLSRSGSKPSGIRRTASQVDVGRPAPWAQSGPASFDNLPYSDLDSRFASSTDGASTRSGETGPISGRDAAIMAAAFRAMLRKPDFPSRPEEEGESPESRNIYEQAEMKAQEQLTQEKRDIQNVRGERGAQVHNTAEGGSTPFQARSASPVTVSRPASSNNIPHFSSDSRPARPTGNASTRSDETGPTSSQDAAIMANAFRTMMRNPGQDARAGDPLTN